MTASHGNGTEAGASDHVRSGASDPAVATHGLARSGASDMVGEPSDHVRAETAGGADGSDPMGDPDDVAEPPVETAPEPADVPADSSTAAASGASGFGDPRIDAAMARLETAGDRTAAEQVAEYEAVHRVLQDTLATIDEA